MSHYWLVRILKVIPKIFHAKIYNKWTFNLLKILISKSIQILDKISRLWMVPTGHLNFVLIYLDSSKSIVQYSDTHIHIGLFCPVFRYLRNVRSLAMIWIADNLFHYSEHHLKNRPFGNRIIDWNCLTFLQYNWKNFHELNPDKFAISVPHCSQGSIS